MTDEILRQALDLGEEIGHITQESIEDDPAAALEIIAHCLSLPDLESQALRHRVGNEILSNVRKNFSSSYEKPFANRIGYWVGVSQELPQFTRNEYLKLSNDKLVDKYRLLRRILLGMRAAGLGVAGNKVRKMPGDAIGGARDAAKEKVLKGSLPDASDVMKGAKSGIVKNLPKSPASALVWIAGAAAYDETSKNKEAVSRELRRRWKRKELPLELYKKAFGDIYLLGVEQLSNIPGFTETATDVDENKEPEKQY